MCYNITILAPFVKERIMKRSRKTKNKRLKRSNPFAKAVRTPLFKSRVEKDRKKEAKKTGKYLDADQEE